MTRPSLPSRQLNNGGSVLFPSFQRELNRLFDQFRSGFPVPDTVQNGAFGMQLFPAIDVVETDDATEISAEVPGVREEDLDVSISGDTLILQGEKGEDYQDNEGNFHLVERRYGSFRRLLPLGFSPDDGAVEAKFTNGVLKLRIAKPEKAKAGVRKIEITKT